jgi:hypothetical protein
VLLREDTPVVGVLPLEDDELAVTFSIEMVKNSCCIFSIKEHTDASWSTLETRPSFRTQENDYIALGDVVEIDLGEKLGISRISAIRQDERNKKVYLIIH